MSAISGVYYFNHEAMNIEDGMILMQGLRQYPSDDIRIWHSDNVFFGCHAQWITPESVGERLPRFSEEKYLAITADAIIDNRQELFERLQVDHTLRKNMTDSELILLAYLKWGEEVPKYLIGDFAFMIWDLRRKLLFGARDFSGTRSLYFYRDPQRFAFCTTIEPLLDLSYVSKSINEQWFAEFLAIPSMVDTVDTLSTAYKNIEQIPPSHSITICDGKVRLSRYCKISFQEPLKFKKNEEYEEAFQSVFQEAVTARTRTHGEVGAQLSGGLDSGAVVSFAAKALSARNKQLQTFSYIPEDHFKDWTSHSYAADERPFIKATVDYVGNISDHYHNFAGNNPLTDLDDSLELMGMPYKFFENFFWLKGIHEKARHKGVKVLLSGARGNYSISWGSWNMTVNYYASLFKRLKWTRLYQELNQYCTNFKTGKSVMLPVVIKRAFPSIYRNSSIHNSSDNPNQTLISDSFAQRTNVYARLLEYGVDITGTSAENPYEIRKRHFEQLYHWNKNGIVGTKLSLRYAVWDRDPTNDLRVIRFCLAVPEEQYVKDGLQRSLIRRSTKNMLPDKVRLNQQVRGIQVADVIHRIASNWHAFIEELNQLVRDPSVSEMLNIGVIKKAITKMGNEPRPELVFENEFRILTRSLMVYRFIKKFT
ncbi:asparagine synthase-related protein [Paenibacillus roseipurpureus]|uniref:asparagine synthase (glutamine-hydrolyzing) n=1 Tax=Paenibacillus roseopurpureus TaxID=2918901 RepID=A0AA96LPU3_9BACL|nr:asparagine synthase-related protein [Paenibacillus sp. MBLB1832]WNR43779.1 asparagine synthase-related protein [Paenibacillus sp. MBLB1832]